MPATESSKNLSVAGLPILIMIVEIPSRSEHHGLYKAKYEISDHCPMCGGPRGKTYRTLSYDGSLRMEVDGWTNECGHVDKYSAVRVESALPKN